jgi:hypothetical protein
MTRGLEGRRSIQLSYGRKSNPGTLPPGVGALGFEPRTSCSQSRRANQTAPRPAVEPSMITHQVSFVKPSSRRRVICAARALKARAR